jgi:hypothetical protein
VNASAVTNSAARRRRIMNFFLRSVTSVRASCLVARQRRVSGRVPRARRLHIHQHHQTVCSCDNDFFTLPDWNCPVTLSLLISLHYRSSLEFRLQAVFAAPSPPAAAERAAGEEAQRPNCGRAERSIPGNSNEEGERPRPGYQPRAGPLVPSTTGRITFPPACRRLFPSEHPRSASSRPSSRCPRDPLPASRFGPVP